MAPTKERDQLIRDVVRDRVYFGEVEAYLRNHLGPEMGGLNVKQNEGILALIQVVLQILRALGAINKDMLVLEGLHSIDDRRIHINVGDSSIYMTKDGDIALVAGATSIKMKKDGSIDIRGKDIRITDAGETVIKAAKNLTLKGQKIMEN